jgi:hypothetical protein
MNIVERLRELAKIDNCQVSFEAADEIERLRKLLKNWVDCCFVNFVTDTIEIVDVEKVYVETRAALKRKE